jgi:hypothetical protein
MIMDILQDDPARFSTARSVKSGANWFFWVAVLSVINSLIVYYFGLKNLFFALGITQWVDGTGGAFTNQGTAPALNETGLAVDILIAAAFAGFGYLARHRHDVWYVIGLFLYVADAMLSLGLKDFFGSFFHLLPLFFLFKGLLASRHVRENATTI